MNENYESTLGEVCFDNELNIMDHKLMSKSNTRSKQSDFSK